jgi:O-antigen ligase
MSNDRHRIHDRIFAGSLAAIAFFLPVYGRAIPLIIIVLVLNWIADGRFMAGFRNLPGDKRSRVVFALAAFYLVYLVGMLYTENMEFGWFDMEIKLSFLIFPMVFATTKPALFTRKLLHRVMLAFVAGCVTGSVILLVHAAIGAFGYRIPGYQIPGSFYYMKLAWYFHASYLSMYFNFAIAFILFIVTGDRSRSRWATTAWFLVLLLLTCMVFLLASKSGLVLFVMVLSFHAIRVLVRLKRPWYALVIVAAGGIAFLTAYHAFPDTFSRVSRAGKVLAGNQARQGVKPESNADRLAILKTGAELLKDHFLFGVGTGDVKDALEEGYRRNAMTPALTHHLNAHNQYLQTFVALGIPGILTLVAMLVIPGLYAFRKKEELYLVFILVVGLSLLFESMFEIQAGVVFYTFFNTFMAAVLLSGDKAAGSSLSAVA